jgi:hypothetical protein
MFSWEAFATLVTGLVAVGAAWQVGRNQIEIQKRQIKLTENDLKVQLLEKRSACIDEMREIADAWFRQASLSNEEWARFHTMFRQAELYTRRM